MQQSTALELFDNATRSARVSVAVRDENDTLTYGDVSESAWRGIYESSGLMRATWSASAWSARPHW
jgi:hypothetical protein